jgi:hypothetical protein
MASYRLYVQQLCGLFEGYEFHHVPRANNDEADRLSKIGSTKQDIPARVSLEIIRKPSIKPSRLRRSLPPSSCPKPGSGSGDATGLGGCRLGVEGSSRPAQRVRLDEGLGGCRLRTGPYSRPTRRSRHNDGPRGC